MIASRNDTYRSDEFKETLVIERRMPKMCDVAIIPDCGPVRYHRLRRGDVAALLRALGHRPVPGRADA